MINTQAIQELIALKLSFPESLQRLAALGIERYLVDLVRMERIFYAKNGSTYAESIFINDMPCSADELNEQQITAALRAAQEGSIDYESFIKKIVINGATCYVVYIDGKKAIYYGRKGDMYSENLTTLFPSIECN